MKEYLTIAAIVLFSLSVLVLILFGSRVFRTLVKWFRDERGHGSEKVP